MPRKIRVLSGKELVKILERYGFELKRKTGSHSRLTLADGQTSFHITVPMHSELKKGTLANILDELKKCIDPPLLEDDFYTE